MREHRWKDRQNEIIQSRSRPRAIEVDIQSYGANEYGDIEIERFWVVGEDPVCKRSHLT
ncbi:hypothetical protein YC2023_010757 [Brassica napus]